MLVIVGDIIFYPLLFSPGLVLRSLPLGSGLPGQYHGELCQRDIYGLGLRGGIGSGREVWQNNILLWSSEVVV